MDVVATLRTRNMQWHALDKSHEREQLTWETDVQVRPCPDRFLLTPPLSSHGEEQTV